MNTIDNVVAALILNNCMAIDCHHQSGKQIEIKAVALLGDTVVALHPDHAAYSLNSLFIGDNGIVHLSTCSNGTMFPEYARDTLEESAEEYNKPENHTRGMEYWKLTDVRYILPK